LAAAEDLEDFTVGFGLGFALAGGTDFRVGLASEAEGFLGGAALVLAAGLGDDFGAGFGFGLVLGLGCGFGLDLGGADFVFGEGLGLSLGLAADLAAGFGDFCLAAGADLRVILAMLI